ncbi:hypothetical protein N7468_005955 [Penicillium chermesinum]|uniref:NADP-dependent oxidoreductase domain-containing protein n=1 Tax=Penicillium chermesinum TaxID=63820 RepID=A0A9W9NZZ9_9EURO|nr:uncharacterized protein N7468_005955 [Penicillium chermesinum]KAJ5232999.1 hypothetical protein N7468_005955 [Penicillium chermesinum]
MANIMTVAPEPKSLLGYHRQLAPNAAVKVSPLCLGSMGFGNTLSTLMGACDKDVSFKMLDFFYENGGNFIDTANVYQNGESELIVGEWMKLRENRDEVVLATKYTSSWQMANPKVKIQSNFGGNNKKALMSAFQASLERLQTDFVDIFYVHSWDFTTTVPEIMHTLQDLVSAGKVLYLGISNTPAWIVSKANEYARYHGLTPFSVYQGQWSAAERDVERDIIPMCNDQGMAFIPYGKTIMADTLDEIARERGTKLTSVALAWARLKEPYIFPVVGGRKIEHLDASIEALGMTLMPEEVETIESAVPFDFGYPQTLLGGPTGATKAADVWLTRRYGHFDWVSKPQAPAARQN